jgi:peptide-methionine (S)-S-oxide reductase
MSDDTGHAEAVEVVFDPERISYRDLLEFFFQVHRPDLGEGLVGFAYRSEIFYTTDKQRQVAEETILDVDASGHWPGKVVTEVSEAGSFWAAEAKDQGYFQRYPDGCTPPSRGRSEPRLPSLGAEVWPGRRKPKRLRRPLPTATS